MPGVTASTFEVDGAAFKLPATLYRPTDAVATLPVILYLHGGGWVIADRHVYDGGARGLALAGESAGGNLAVATAIAVKWFVDHLIRSEEAGRRCAR